MLVLPWPLSLLVPEALMLLVAPTATFFTTSMCQDLLPWLAQQRPVFDAVGVTWAVAEIVAQIWAGPAVWQATSPTVWLVREMGCVLVEFGWLHMMGLLTVLTGLLARHRGTHRRSQPYPGYVQLAWVVLFPLYLLLVPLGILFDFLQFKATARMLSAWGTLGVILACLGTSPVMLALFLRLLPWGLFTCASVVFIFGVMQFGLFNASDIALLNLLGQQFSLELVLLPQSCSMTEPIPSHVLPFLAHALKHNRYLQQLHCNLTDLGLAPEKKKEKRKEKEEKRKKKKKGNEERRRRKERKRGEWGKGHLANDINTNENTTNTHAIFNNSFADSILPPPPSVFCFGVLSPFFLFLSFYFFFFLFLSFSFVFSFFLSSLLSFIHLPFVK